MPATDTFTHPCDHLARVGFDLLLGPEATPPDDEDDPASVEAARLADHARVREALVSAAAPEPRAGGLAGAKWLGRVITWPDRVPGLKTWAGQSTLPKIIAGHQRRLREAGPGDLFDVRGVSRTSKGEGPSGIDPLSAVDAIDAGFSPSKLGMDVACRPGVELLAVVGLESLPLVSFGPRDVGYLYGGEVWRFAAEARDTGYHHRWVRLARWTDPTA